MDSNTHRDSVGESFMAAFTTLNMTATIERHLRRYGSPEKRFPPAPWEQFYENPVGDDSSLNENTKNEQNYLANFENKSEGVGEVLDGSPGLLEGQEPKVIGIAGRDLPGI